MAKILGLDIGTDSIGYATTEQTKTGYRLLDKGVFIFKKGVAYNKGVEQPAVQVRTDARARRRHYYRRRLRKIELLKVLVAHDLCPYVSQEELDQWRYAKIYPTNDAFLNWQRTDDNKDKNPYHDRYIALTNTLDLSVRKNRHLIGRALYHLAQRRGFYSNRKDQTNESEIGIVQAGTRKLDQAMADASCEFLGEFFYLCYCSGDKIRTSEAYGYTARVAHYEKEFYAICDRQNLPAELRTTLYRAIYFQRKNAQSQKGLVGHCTLEPNKARCPISHPLFEAYRMYSFINNIKIKTPADSELRALSAEEYQLIEPLFYRKSKPTFSFEDIAKKISGNKKGCYGHILDKGDFSYRFNFKMATSVSGSPVTTCLRDLFGKDWATNICERYAKKGAKTQDQIVNDIWHALFYFDDDAKLCVWAKENLQLDENKAKKFANIKTPQGYAALSLKAIRKILPWLRDEGFRYDEAVTAANLPSIIPSAKWNDKRIQAAIIQDLRETLKSEQQNPYYKTRNQAVRNMLLENWDINFDTSKRLYEPSRLDVYEKAEPNSEGIFQLGSPRISSIRNPMAMRALFRLRVLINTLLREGKIDPKTKINIELARELNDANRRKAIEQIQLRKERDHKQYEDAIKAYYAERYGEEIKPTDDNILKYQLWKEQREICLYTGKHIDLRDFIDKNPSYDIEHTVPYTRGGDNSQMNNTLCDFDYNRRIKGAMLPTELADYPAIMERIEALGWKERCESLYKQIQHTKGNFETKEIRDQQIQKRHRLKMELDYWKGKLARFTMTEVPDGFANRQGVDVGIIGKYAKSYLESVFHQVYTIKGATTADFRKMWGLQDKHEKKDRRNHAHHCIDAITIACIDSGAYAKWAQFRCDEERYDLHQGNRPIAKTPWPTFTEDVKNIADELLIAHHTPNNLPKHSRKRLRKGGKIQFKDKNTNEAKYLQGDTARTALHAQTFYGAIKQSDEIKYVIRKSLKELKPDEANRIVDPEVLKCVQAAIEKEGFPEAMSKPICFNKDKGVYIKKVRIFTANNISPKPLGNKVQRDSSKHDYKQPYYVVYGNNYCMALYERINSQGKRERSFKLVNNFDAVRFYNNKTDHAHIAPLTDANGCSLKYILRAGTMVLFYDQTPEELYNCSHRELVKRLYRVTGLEADGRVTFTFHQEARDEKQIKAECGRGVTEVDMYNPAPRLRLSCKKFNICVEKYDFILTATGEIKFKHKD